MSNTGKKMTGNQQRKIFVYYAKLGIQNDRARQHEIQEAIIGKKSLTTFTKSDAIKLTQHLISLNGEDPKKGFVEHPERRKPQRAPWEPAQNDPKAPPTAEQLAELTRIFEAMGATPAQRMEWVRRQTGKLPGGPFNFPPTVASAQKLILGARAMRDSGYRFDVVKQGSSE